jgi:predicted ATPase
VLCKGCLLAVSATPSDAVQIISSGLTAYRATGATVLMTYTLSSFLPSVYAQLDQFDDAWDCINEALVLVEKTNERWCEAEAHRFAGELALMCPDHDVAKAQTYFDRALAVARQQQAKSRELRASMSLARLWRDQDKLREGRELLAPVYGWFTEGFETRDLKDRDFG